MYSPIYKANQLIYGHGKITVVTGWTVKELVAKHLDPQCYAAIGQLYSPTRGVNLLLRNLLANPHIRHVVVLNATREDKNSGGCQALIDFFRRGVAEGMTETGRKCWLIQSAYAAYIDIEVPKSALDELAAHVEVHEAKSISDLVKTVNRYVSENLLPWGEPKEYPMQVVESNVLPGPVYGHRIEGETIAETWVKIIHRIKTTGIVRPTSHGGQWQELINVMAIVNSEPIGFYVPEPNYLPISPEFIGEYIAQVIHDSENENAYYTYGQRLRSWFGRDQIEHVIEVLANDLNSSRAVMSLWDSIHDGIINPPCLNHIWVRVVDAKLSLTATFRSNDMFSAWAANAMGLRALQCLIFDRLCRSVGDILELGPLITVSQSAHIYDDCWASAENIIETQYPKIMKYRLYNDPTGSFVVSVKNDVIFVEHITPGNGEVVNCFSGKSAIALYKEIATACPGMQLEHGMYLGMELQKAFEKIGKASRLKN